MCDKLLAMAPFSISAPSIIPLRLPVLGGPRSIDTITKIQLLCETYLDHEIFYTIDGTKPQPYAGIVQGNKTIKYGSPFCLPAGKIAVKAIAINANIHTMCSSIVTKCFEVLPVESGSSAKKKTPSKTKENCDVKSKILRSHQGTYVKNKKNSKTIDYNQNTIDCLENAFIDTFDDEVINITPKETQSDETDFTSSFDKFGLDVSDESDSVQESEIGKSCVNLSGIADLSMDNNDTNSFENHERSFQNDKEKKSVDASDVPSNWIHSQSMETQFCCIKCDLTLQHCSSCNKMNAVSSKFCIKCGNHLIQVCTACKQHNPRIALFCQYCGRKLVNAVTKLDSLSMVDSSIMVKPKSKNASIQKFPVLVDKGTQTHLDKTYAPKSPTKRERKEIPPHSPGRGYWHLQLDYICNHLKTHAYNNLEFRKVISEPSLCHFKSAHVSKDDENVTVTVVFSPFSQDKCNSNGSRDSKLRSDA